MLSIVAGPPTPCGSTWWNCSRPVAVQRLWSSPTNLHRPPVARPHRAPDGCRDGSRAGLLRVGHPGSRLFSAPLRPCGAGVRVAVRAGVRAGVRVGLTRPFDLPESLPFDVLEGDLER